MTPKSPRLKLQLADLEALVAVFDKRPYDKAAAARARDWCRNEAKRRREIGGKRERIVGYEKCRVCRKLGRCEHVK